MRIISPAGPARKGPYPTAKPAERAFLLGVEAKDGQGRWTAQESLEELAQLVITAGGKVTGRLYQKLRSPHRQSYIGPGKLMEVAALRERYDTVVCDDELTPSQQRHLEDALQVKIIDRTALILDIFAQRARTHEGRLQVELAQHQYLFPRLAGRWAHLERLGGGIGTRGPGESQLETDRRLIRRKIAHLQKQLDEVSRHRSLYRRQRSRQGLPVIAIVGYTNAGKSALFNALCKADVPVEDKLFATLDPTTRRLWLPSGQETLLTDTVGFIQKLPPAVVAAFRATLEELEEASLLLHVVDITHPKSAQQGLTVDDTLGQLGLAQKRRVTTFNKVDLLVSPDGVLRQAQDSARAEDVIRHYDRDLAQKGLAGVVISATRGWGLDKLVKLLDRELGDVMAQNKAAS